MMGRTALTAVLAAAILQSAALAQTNIPTVGFVNNGSQQAFRRLADEFRLGLEETGFQVGKNVNIEYRWGEGDNERLKDLVRDLAQRKSSVIVATGGTPTALAAKDVAATIPVIFTIGADPIKFGLVSSLSNPGGNITGVSFLANTVLAKQVEILNEIVPKDAALGFLANPSNPNAAADIDTVVAAAKTLDRKLVVSRATSSAEIEGAFKQFASEKIGGLLIFPDATFTSNRELLLRMIAAQKLPAVYNSREFAVAGGLIGYGARQSVAYRQAGRYAGRILKGEKPSDLPVVQSTAIELIVNLKTAKELQVNVPISLIGRADEVIE